MLNGDALYSIKRAGIQALERMGKYYLGANLEREQDPHEFQVPHAARDQQHPTGPAAHSQTAALDSGVFHSCIEPVARDRAYAKVYDAIARVTLPGGEVEFALEYERTLKSPAKYERIREAIEAEQRVKAFLYLVPSYDLLIALQQTFRQTRQLVLFGLVDEFKSEHLTTTVRYANYFGVSLEDALSKLVKTEKTLALAVAGRTA